MTTKKPVARAPRSPRRKDTVAVGIRMPISVVKEADQYAEQDDRTRGAFMRMMFLRGFEDYKREVAARSQIGLSQKEGTKAGAQPHSRKIEED